MIKKKILITGANGQLGQCIKGLAHTLDDKFEFVYANSAFLDITNQNQVVTYFNKNKFNYVVNCAAFTAVDKAETETEAAYNVNANGPENLANACLKNDATLIHVSTDFVFDGERKVAYNELDKTNPVSVYGETKLKGENKISTILEKYFILRTSWLYSEHANNFVKTMLRLGNERDTLSVVADQFGTPTYAVDLASAILEIMKNEKTEYGLYHYSNEGAISWYDFAKKIFELSNTIIELSPIKTEAYPTPATRPKYSVMDKSKINRELGVEIINWEKSLGECLKKLNK